MGRWLTLLTTALVTAGTASAQPMRTLYRSLEEMALSGPQLIGTPIRIQPPVTGGEQIKVSVVFRDWRPLGSGGGDYPEIGAFLSVDKAKVEGWIASKSRILVLRGGSWINLSDPKTKIFDANLNRVVDENELVRRMQQTYWDHPEIEQVRTFVRKLFDDEAKRMGVDGTDPSLLVPYDRNVEKWAISNLASKDWERRWHGVNALTRFKSKGNVERLRKLLSDPHSVLQGEVLTYPIRKSAASVLARWGEDAANGKP